jgi:hypothetical protein
MAHPFMELASNSEAAIDVKPYFAGFYGQNKKTRTPAYSVTMVPNGVYSATMDGSVLKVNAVRPDAQGVFSVDVTVDDGETTFTQPFGIIITPDPTGIRKPTVDIDQIEAVKREFFTTDGRQVAVLQPHGVYVMKVTDRRGIVHTAKIIAQ